MISQIKQQGFTIVELLIVIVVIAILAALSYVGYTSITARANNSTAAATAKAVKDAASVYQGANGSYPTTRAEFLSGGTDPVAKLPDDVKFPSSAVTYANRNTAAQALTGIDAPKTALVYACGTTGFEIYVKDFASGATNAKKTTVGDCTTAPTGSTL